VVETFKDVEAFEKDPDQTILPRRQDLKPNPILINPKNKEDLKPNPELLHVRNCFHKAKIIT